jgi:hypothetical protein
MTEAVNFARSKNDYAPELDAYRCSDEVNAIDSIFFEK